MRVNYTFAMLALAVALFSLLMPEYAMASASQAVMPWDSTLMELSKSIKIGRAHV